MRRVCKMKENSDMYFGDIEASRMAMGDYHS